MKSVRIFQRRFFPVLSLIWIFLVVFVSAVSVDAEPSAHPFFRLEPSFPEAGRDTMAGGLLGFNAWVAAAHIINQRDSPWFGHELRTAVDLGFYSSDVFKLGAAFVQNYFFKVNPISEWWLWARALLSDIELHADFNVAALFRGLSGIQTWPSASASLFFRHDCKHDMEGFYGRTAVHDAIGLNLFHALPTLKLNERLSASGKARLSGELFLGRVFQELTPEPYETRFSAEALIYPLILDEKWHFSVEGRISALAVSGGTAVLLRPGWYIDYRIQLGLDANGASGRVRVGWYADHCVDPLTDNKPEPAFTTGLLLALIFSGS